MKLLCYSFYAEKINVALAQLFGFFKSGDKVLCNKDVISPYTIASQIGIHTEMIKLLEFFLTFYMFLCPYKYLSMVTLR